METEAGLERTQVYVLLPKHSLALFPAVPMNKPTSYRAGNKVEVVFMSLVLGCGHAYLITDHLVIGNRRMAKW